MMKGVLSAQPTAGASVVTDPTYIWKDPVLHKKLQTVRNIEIRQGNLTLEAITGGIWANTYVIGDRDTQVEVGCS